MRNLAAALALVAGLGCDSGPLCDHDAAEAALAAAVAGETVELGACEVQGPLHVPPGVTLAGTDGTVVVAPVESGGVIALGGETATTVRDLAVRVEGRIGVLFRGGGLGRVSNVTFDARRGIGLGAAELAGLELSNVTLTGPIHADNADDSRWLSVAPAPVEPGACADPSCECTPGDMDVGEERVCDADGDWVTWTATYGLVLTEVAGAVLTDVNVDGFAAWGALLTRSEVSWTGGGVHDTLGTGIRQTGGTLAVDGVAAERTHGGVRGTRPYGILMSDGARIDGRRLSLIDNDRFGLVLGGGNGALTDVVATGNGDVALWVTQTTELTVEGAGTVFSDNGFAAVVLVEASGVRIAEGTIETTREVERQVGAIGRVLIGDGVHVSLPTGPIELADLVLDANERAGLLVDLGGAGATTFSGVMVDGTGAQLGAVAGRTDGMGGLTAEMPAGWDTGITRAGATLANDAAFSGSVPAVTETLPEPIGDPGNVLGVVAPMF